MADDTTAGADEREAMSGDEAVANLRGWLEGRLILSEASVRVLLDEREQLRAQIAAIVDLDRCCRCGGRVRLAYCATCVDQIAATRAETAEVNAAYWRGRAESAWNEGDRAANDLVAAVFGDNGDREEFRRKWARIAALGGPEIQHRAVSLQLGTIVKLNTDDLRRRDEWIEGTRHEVRTVYRTPWREAEEGGEPT